MGNCLTSKAIPAENQENEQPREANTAAACQSSTFKEAKKVENRKEKKVRFRLSETDAGNRGESCRETKNGVVRIRLVLTQNELNQILNSEKLNHSSAEQLLNIAMIKSRSTKRLSQGRSSHDLERIKNRMMMQPEPVLESIPEDNRD